VILHLCEDNVIPFAGVEEIVDNSGLPQGMLVEVGNDHRFADPKPLKAMLDTSVQFGGSYGEKSSKPGIRPIHSGNR
jgi:hypothetical protein